MCYIINFQRFTPYEQTAGYLYRSSRKTTDKDKIHSWVEISSNHKLDTTQHRDTMYKKFESYNLLEIVQTHWFAKTHASKWH